MSTTHDLKPASPLDPQPGALTRRQMIKGGVMAAAAGAIFCPAISNLSAESPSFPSHMPGPGVKLSVLFPVPAAKSVSQNGELKFRRAQAERYVIVSSKAFSSRSAKGLDYPLVRIAVLRKIDVQGNPIAGQRDMEVMLGPLQSSSAHMWVIGHDHFPAFLARVESSEPVILGQ